MRKPKKYHYIYRITRCDGKYYVGMHSTDDLNDGYFGSGKRIRRSINKHGIGIHIKEILEFLPDRELLKYREAEIVNEECVNDPRCMNIALGGGSADHLNVPEMVWQKSEAGKKGGSATQKKLLNDPFLYEQRNKRSSEVFKQLHKQENKLQYILWKATYQRNKRKNETNT